MNVFEEILLAFGGNALLLGVLAFLTRSLIQTWLAKDIKKFEAELQDKAATQLQRLRFDLKSQGDVSIEQLKSRLQQAALEHQVRFSKLHEERAEKIAELYKRIVEQSAAGQRYVSERGGSTPSEKFFKLHRDLEALDSFYETNRIYFPEHVSGLLARLLSTIKKPAGTAFLYSETDHVANTDEFREMRRQELKVALDAFETEVPAARKALEDEFRKMLGVEFPGS
jgi:hypothetical protein